MDTIFMLNLAGIVAFGVAVLGFFYMMGKKARRRQDRKDSGHVASPARPAGHRPCRGPVQGQGRDAFSSSRPVSGQL